MTVKYRTRLTVLLVFDMRGTAENAVPLFLSANRLGCGSSGPRSTASLRRPQFGQSAIAGLSIQNTDSTPLHRFSKAQPTRRKIRQKSGTLLPVFAQFPLSLLPIVNKRVLLFNQWQKRKRAEEPALFFFSLCSHFILPSRTSRTITGESATLNRSSKRKFPPARPRNM